MKRAVVAIVIIAGLLLVALIAIPVFRKMRVNSASIAMMVVSSDLNNHVRTKGEWPRSLDELYPMPGSDRRRFADDVSVNWELTKDDITAFMDGIDTDARASTRPPEIELPFVLKYSDRVPRHPGSARTERNFSWWTLREAYMDLPIQDDDVEP